MKNMAMMWLNTDVKKTLSENILEAAKYHKDKYGKYPTQCFVNPKDIIDVEYVKEGEINVYPLRSILPRHLWIGNDVK